MASNWRAWIAKRFGLDKLRENTLERRVPETPFLFGDGASMLLLLAVLVLTGIFMTLAYSPTPDTAYRSVQYITDDLRLGWFIRGLHYWSAGLFVVMIFFHLFRQILLGGYKSPREGTWLTGVVMFIAVIAMAFIGYLLRWDERAVNAIYVVLHMFSRVPLIGEELVVFVQGGEEIGSSTLLRLYAVHVVFVPLVLIGLALWHLYLVILHGVISRGEREKNVETAEEQEEVYHEEAATEERGEAFYPDTAAKSGLMALLVFLVALGLTLLAGPPALFPEADLTEVSRPRSEWWFWWYDALIAVVPSVVAPALVVVLPLAALLVLLLLPFVDRGPRRGLKSRPVATVTVAILVLSMLILSQLRLDAPWEGGPQPGPPPVPDGIELTESAEEGRQLFHEYGCNSCHAVSGVGPEVAIDLAGGDRRLTEEEIRGFILHPEDVPMPSYEGRLSDEELERIVAFVFSLQAAPMDP